ncbi:GerMN domain-containing protein [Lachnospiraceae bacterium LCP25S3_G4]
MKKKPLLLLVFILVILIWGCTRKQVVKNGEPYIYEVNMEGTDLMKVPYTVGTQDTKNEVERMLQALATPSDDGVYKATIPAGVDVLNFEVNQNELHLNFNTDYTKMSHVEEVLCRAGVVQSLLKITGIEYVSFYVDTVPLMDVTGETIGLMQADEFVQNTGSSLHSYQKATLNLYFANKSGDKLIKETRTVRYSSNISIEKLIVEQLMKGPSSEEGNPVITPNTKVLGVSIKDGIGYVNFDKEFLNQIYDLKPDIPIYALVNSIIEGANVSQVQISINGETDAIYLGEVDLSKPFERNLDIVEEAFK